MKRAIPEILAEGGMTKTGLAIIACLSISAVALADDTGIVKIVSFEDPQNGLGNFTYTWTLGAIINSVTRVDGPAWSAVQDGAARINCSFAGYGNKAVAGASFYTASSGYAGLDLSGAGYKYLLAAVGVDDNATFVPNALDIKMYDKTGSAWLYNSGPDTNIANANTWYLLAWPIATAGNLSDVRELGIDVWSNAVYSGNVYVEFLGASATVPEPSTLAALALGMGCLAARKRRV
jgi:hypothetical protein